ncbi:MAG TPA: hypothetical protein VD905_13665 [Flavobacteriales bacterium]|nr:hypothetical protein [Flavobacteriales bacterium]
MKSQYIISEHYNNLAFQPQIGLGFVRIHFMYGYNVYAKRPDGLDLPRNCFSIWCSIPAMAEEQNLCPAYDR